MPNFDWAFSSMSHVDYISSIRDISVILLHYYQL